MTGVPHDERLARLGLSRVAEPGSLAVYEALKADPAVDVWDAVRQGRPLGQVGQQALDGMAVRVQECEPERDLERLTALGGRVVCPGDEEWPEGLWWDPSTVGAGAQMAPPFVLQVRGRPDLRAAVSRSVAVVGSRAATAYGIHVAGELGHGLSEAGCTVVSGGAHGIDSAAHRGALTAGGAPTVVVLACGLDRAYPRANDRLFDQVAESGFVVSEVPPGSAPTRLRFLVRNRLVAGLARGTVVVEAGLRSGSSSTVSRAHELDRKVMAVPGPVTSATSAGCHERIREGKAVLVTDAAQVLEVVAVSGEHLLPPRRGAVHPRDDLELTARAVLDAVPVRVPIGVARIAAAAGVPAVTVQRLLPALLLADLVEQRDGGWKLTTLGASKPASPPANDLGG